MQQVRTRQTLGLLSSIYMIAAVVLLPLRSSAYHLPPALVRYAPPSMPMMPMIQTSPTILQEQSLLLLSLNNEPPRTQREQMRDAMVLKTMRGTEWRLVEDRGPAMTGGGEQQQCLSNAVFSGFFKQPNKGIMSYDSQSCNEASSGRWITKPSARAVQLSPRWKVKLPAGQFIYRGFIKATKTIGRNGLIEAEMMGDIITGDEIGKEKIVGKFRADLIRQFDSSNVKIGQSNGPIVMTPK